MQMTNIRLPRPRLLFAVATVALGACTGIRHYTYEVELTTNREPHTVQLWYDEGQGAGEKPAFSLTFPQSYYAYRDNHEAEKQTVIGLLLDRQTLGPLTEIVARETGTLEALRVPGQNATALTKELAAKYLHRQLWVSIRGRTAPPPIARRDPAKTYGEMYEQLGQQAGFVVYRVRHAPTHEGDGGLPEIVGFASSTPDLSFYCMGLPEDMVRTGTIPPCDVEQPYRESVVSIRVDRADLSHSWAFMLRVRKLLDRHRT